MRVSTLINIARFLNVDPGTFIRTGEGDIAKDIAALLEDKPALAEALHEATLRVQKGEISPLVFQEVVSYIVWRLNAAGIGVEAIS